MSSIFGILNTSRQGILAQQAALAVTGNNIANVNTAGYSRQRANLEALPTGGVSMTNIERLRDNFLVSSARAANAELGASSTLTVNLQNLESILGESTNSSLSTAMSDFFGSLSDLSLQPSGTTEREVLRSQGRQLTTTFESIAGQLRQTRQQLDLQVQETVNQVNSLSQEIADLNKKLGDLGVNNSTIQNQEVNQILDQRDHLVDQLSSIMPLNVIEDANGSMTIFGGSQILVEGINVRQLSTVTNNANDQLSEVVVRDASGNMTSMVGNLSGGSLGAILEVRDGYAKDALCQVERMAAQLARDINVQHRAGTGLDGVSGRNFFDGVATTATAAWSNTGGATVSSTAILNDTQLTFDDYEIRFTANNSFDIVNKTSGSTVSANNAYISGGAIDFAGMRVVLSNGASGSPAAGDVFAVNAYSGTTKRLTLSAAVAADTQAIATGLSSAAGDNRNILSLAALRDAKTMGNPPTQTFESFYDTARLRLSMAAQSAASMQKSDEITQQQIQGLSDSVSGVSVDEESINILQFQRAFEASSRVISVTDELLQSLLNMI